jgi:hypothetical protein
VDEGEWQAQPLPPTIVEREVQ